MFPSVSETHATSPRNSAPAPEANPAFESGSVLLVSACRYKNNKKQRHSKCYYRIGFKNETIQMRFQTGTPKNGTKKGLPKMAQKMGLSKMALKWDSQKWYKKWESKTWHKNGTPKKWHKKWDSQKCHKKWRRLARGRCVRGDGVRVWPRGITAAPAAPATPEAAVAAEKAVQMRPGPPWGPKTRPISPPSREGVGSSRPRDLGPAH